MIILKRRRTCKEKYLFVSLIIISGLLSILRYYYPYVPNYQPGHKSSHLTIGLNFGAITQVAHYDVHKDVIPRTAYYNGQFVTVLAEVNAKVLEQDLILSCQIKNHYSTHVQVVHDPIMKWVQNNKRGYTHFFAVIYCYGLGKNDNDTVKILYSPENSDTVYRSIGTEKSFHILSDGSLINSNSVIVCVTMYGHPVRFDEWLRYQKTIGVDKVHISAQMSFFVRMEDYPFLIESLANGFVRVEVWKRYLKENEIFYHSQSLVYQDCVLRYQSSFEYAMMADYDDFFIPLIPTESNIHYYLREMFVSKNIASVSLPWIEYHCEPSNYTFLADGNVTDTLRQDFSRRLEHKSIHRLNAVSIVSIHSAYKIKPGYEVRDVNLAYFAHVRPRKWLCKSGI